MSGETGVRPHRTETLRIDYGPGEAAEWPYRHRLGAYVYVVEGAVRMGLEGEDPQILREGNSLYAPPGAVPATSENASDTESASLVAAFVGPG
jgi:quercetin dioxygenase-like cupin family protein